MTNHLVGVSEIARLLGVSRQRAVQVVVEYADFPKPAATLASGRIWEREAVEFWLRAHSDRRPGRPKRLSNEGHKEAGEP